ncbi:MAG: hypothetical protein MUC33_19160 [Desulfobacterales bacterium]|jgi:hypothetical protein|nr:hypothetical protein [Desulfobacterales bacterium]
METKFSRAGLAVRTVRLMTGLICALSLPNAGWAAFGDDPEKPRPEFTRQEERVAAKLIPRGKSTSVLIEFQASGGRLLGIEGVDFDPAGQRGMDPKDFRSDLFAVTVGGVAPGGEVRLSLSSNYFTQATELWAFNRGSQPPWLAAPAENIERPGRVQELVVAVKDGGPLDSDGASNGEIVLILGPRDFFWGYALGTLLIRFFGVFLVLGVLQAGMLLAGQVFQLLDRRKEAPQTLPVRAAAADGPESRPEDIGPEAATAIGVALHLHLAALRASAALSLEPADASSWARQGRTQIMRDRLLTHDRPGRK